MNFEVQQLVTFSIMLGAGLAVTVIALSRVIYLARRAPAGQARTDWILMAVFLSGALVMTAFQLWRIIIRF